MSWWPEAWTDVASDWTYIQIPPGKTPDKLASEVLVKDKAYLNVRLRSMRIVHVRKGLSKFYGTVHSVISIPHLSGQPAVFHTITTPGELQKVDAANIDRVIVMDRRLLGPVPYRGGDVDVELGLFSIKEADLVLPFLQLLESMSKAAGVTFVSAALPFAEPIAKGIELLAGSDQNSILEVGLSTSYSQLTTGYFAVIRAPKSVVTKSQLRVDDDKKLVDDLTGKPVEEYPYVVFSIEGSKERDDWFEIPEISAAYNRLRDAVLHAKGQQEVNDAFTTFRLTMLCSPDLLSADAKSLVQKVLDETYSVWVRGEGESRAGSELRDLKELDLYNRVQPVALAGH